jgi:hypothetical protein
VKPAMNANTHKRKRVIGFYYSGIREQVYELLSY